MAIIARDMAIDENAENVAAVRKAIADLENLMGDTLTEDIERSISRLLSLSYQAGYSTGGADARYEG